MAEQSTTSVTETVEQKSAGTVKIAIEEYNDLQLRANRPQTVVYNRIEKTPEMQATDLVRSGAIMMSGGGVFFVLGVVQFIAGKGKLKALKA